MKKFQSKVKTNFGEIIINFDSIDEIKNSINDLNITTVSDLLHTKFGRNIIKEIRSPKPGFEFVYQFTPDGDVELFKIPPSKAETIALVLFAHHPKATSTIQISLSSGVKNAASTILTHPNYKKFWWKTQEGDYIMSQEGIEWVTKKIGPELKSSEKKEAHD